MSSRSTWYPVGPGELTETPIAIIECGRVIRVMPANELQPNQIGYLVIDIPDDQEPPKTLDEALGMAEVCMI